jgi:O-antigen/teichoic acid export membrane protein
VNAYLVKKLIPEISFFHIDIRKWIQIISKSYVFVLIGLFAGLYYKIDVFFLNFMKGQTDVGIYSAGYKFLEAFLFIPASYNMTSTPIFARLQKKSTQLLKSRIKRDFILLSLIGFGVSLAVYFIAPLILPIIMKGSISRSIPVLKIVIFALPFTLISSVFFNTLYVLNKPKFVIWLFLIQTIVVIILNYIFIPVYSYTASAYITVFAEVVNLVVLMAAVSLYLKKS